MTFKNFAGLIDYLEMENMSGRPVDTITPAEIEAIRIEEIKEEIKRELYMSKRADKEYLRDIPMACKNIIVYITEHDFNRF